MEIVNWRPYFCGFADQYASHFAVATARAGNVIGVGDLAEDRLLLDVMSTVAAGESLVLRQPKATRLLQHV